MNEKPISDNIWIKAIDKWGRDAQLFMVVEELAELQQSISKVYRQPTKENWLQVIEEMVDTEIMKNQVFEMLRQDIGRDYARHYDRIYSEKMSRLRKILDESVSKKEKVKE